MQTRFVVRHDYVGRSCAFLYPKTRLAKIIRQIKKFVNIIISEELKNARNSSSSEY